jgi:hypothetical protein
MRKLTLLFMFIVATMFASAQNLQLHYDFGADRGYLTTTLEKFAPDKYGSTFFFVDFNYDKKGPTEAYWEIARELKNWDGPLSVHVEYNGGLHTNVVSEVLGIQVRNSFQINNAYLLGGTYTWNAANFSKGFSLSAMYKNIQGNDSPHNFQLTGVWYINFLDGKLSFSGFADLWSEKHTVSNDGFKTDFQDASLVFLSEPQLWYNLNKAFSVGGEVELGYNFGGVAGFNVCPTLGAKWTF